MTRTILAIAGLSLSAASAFATNTLTGKFTWVTGTLGSSITISGKPQTVQIKVGNVTDTFINTYVTGDVGTVIEAGTPMLFLERGSSPFEAAYTNLNLVVAGLNEASDALARRTVPMLTGGSLEYNVACQGNPFRSGMAFLVPKCTVGSIDFTNGLAMLIDALVPSYSLTVATGTGTTLNPVNFPSSSVIPNSVNFIGYGDGSVTFSGQSMASLCEVSGNVTGTPTRLTAAYLFFTNSIVGSF